MKESRSDVQDYCRTDLACEWGAGCSVREPILRGIKQERVTFSQGTVETLQVADEDTAKHLGRPRGTYITLSCRPVASLESEAREAVEGELARLLLQLLHRACGRAPDASFSVLVVGLGNRQITPDAIGPRVVDELLVTRHLQTEEPEIYTKMGCCAVSAMAPGVLGQSGMEAADLVAGAVRRCRPDAVVAIDALAARSPERLASTVQLTDTGIAPGSGIGNRRGTLDRATLGLPVIGLGIPTVVDSSTLVYDALCRAGIHRIDDRLRQVLDNGRRFYVSPKEADLITDRTASLVAHAINRALVGVPTLQ